MSYTRFQSSFVAIVVILTFTTGCSQKEDARNRQQHETTSTDTAVDKQDPAVRNSPQRQAEEKPSQRPAATAATDPNLAQSQAPAPRPPTVISEDDSRPVSRDELMNHPVFKEMARRQSTDIEGLQVKYSYSGLFGSDGIADSGSAYLDGKLIGEANAMRIVGETPTRIEVEVRHFSDSGKVTYRGLVQFVVGNSWNPGDDPILPGAPMTTTALEGRKLRTIFNRWPVGAPF